MKYRTIVADPPWDYLPPGKNGRNRVTYQTMPIEAICALPDGSYDLVERVSPGPYLELFARRQRLGWDTWGNEALNHVDLGQEPEQKLGNDEWDGTLPVPCGVLLI